MKGLVFSFREKGLKSILRSRVFEISAGRALTSGTEICCIGSGKISELYVYEYYRQIKSCTVLKCDASIRREITKGTLIETQSLDDVDWTLLNQSRRRSLMVAPIAVSCPRSSSSVHIRLPET